MFSAQINVDYGIRTGDRLEAWSHTLVDSFRKGPKEVSRILKLIFGDGMTKQLSARGHLDAVPRARAAAQLGEERPAQRRRIR